MIKSLRKQIFNKALIKELDGCSVDNKEIVYRAYHFIKTNESLDKWLENECSCMQGITDYGCDVRQAYNNMQRCARMIAHSYGLSF